MNKVTRPSPDVVRRVSEHDEIDYARVCDKHKWASAWSTAMHGLLRCPACEADTDKRANVRYKEIVAAERDSAGAGAVE